MSKLVGMCRRKKNIIVSSHFGRNRGVLSGIADCDGCRKKPLKRLTMISRRFRYPSMNRGVNQAGA
jgi:hypothetical protein